MSGYQKQPIPDTLRWTIWERDDFTCHYCGSRKFLSVDHIVPESQGGELSLDNLVTACRPCNSKKGTSSYSRFVSCADVAIYQVVVGRRPLDSVLNIPIQVTELVSMTFANMDSTALTQTDQTRYQELRSSQDAFDQWRRLYGRLMPILIEHPGTTVAEAFDHGWIEPSHGSEAADD